jgi:hypothetical protein
LLAAALLVEIALMRHDGDDLMGTSVGLGLITLLVLAINSGLSWREERESGALELLSVTSLSTSAILNGRWRALFAHYLPAFGCVFVAFWVGFLAEESPWDANRHIGTDEWLWTLFLNLGAISAWTMVPLVGMYSSLRLRSAFAAILTTAVVGVLIPWLSIPIAGAVILLLRETSSFLAGLIPHWTQWSDRTVLVVCGCTGLALQLAVGVAAAVLSHRGMERRTLARS